MPTINEVWEQALLINANLATVHNDLTAINDWCESGDAHLQELIARLDVANSRLQTLIDVSNAGYAALADGLDGVQARQDQTNLLLNFQAQQQQTMICILEKISRHTCGIWNEADQQTDLQERAAASARALETMFAIANGDAGLAYHRQLDEEARLAECCPPDERKPPCRYEPCPEPKAPRRDRPKEFDGFTPVSAEAEPKGAAKTAGAKAERKAKTKSRRTAKSGKRG